MKSNVKKTIEELRTIFYSCGYNLITTNYVNGRQKLHCLCSNGHDYFVTWTNFQQGNRCIKCLLLKKSQKTLANIKKSLKAEGYSLLSTEYQNSKQKLESICPSGHLYEFTWNNWKWSRKHRCKICHVESLKKNFDEIKRQVEKENYQILSETYKNSRIKLASLCSEGHYYEFTWNSWQRGNRCGECDFRSKGEEKIKKILEKYELIYRREVRFEKCKNKNTLPFDFAVYDNSENINCLIEYQGKQHYEEVKRWGGKEGLSCRTRNDKIKSKFCEENKIPLIKIPYYEYKNIEKIIKETKWN